MTTDFDNMDTQLTDEQSDELLKDGNEFIASLKEDTKDIKNVINYDDNPDNLPRKNMEVIIDPVTGENKILGSTEDIIDESTEDSFQNMVDKINNDEEDFVDDTPITEEEATEYATGDGWNNSVFGEIAKGTNLSPEAIRDLLQVANRRIKKEKFSVYNEMPQEVKSIVDTYVMEGGSNAGLPMNQLNNIKHNVAEVLLDEFISEIQLDRSKNDFARDLENIYRTSAKEISDASLEYIDERNKAYREAAEEIEDEDKKAKLLAILDRIDEARALTTLKEFAKTCKIKPIELEKPQQRAYSSFLAKYRTSTNNIYDIKIARASLYKHLIAVDPTYTEKDVDAFFIAFCKQVNNYSVSVATDHAYMYYVLYYCAMLDGDRSDTYINNVKEVIANLRARNHILTK